MERRTQPLSEKHSSYSTTPPVFAKNPVYSAIYIKTTRPLLGANEKY